MTIVVAYADTPPGHAALRHGVTEAARRGEDVVLVPAVRDRPLPDPGAIAQRWPAVFEALQETGGKVSVETADLQDPGDAVVQVAQWHDASMIVVGLRHRSPVGKVLLGSTAQRILLDATTPVLGVKADT
ncbi:universal stress protein [Nocardioides rotundus]|uniref:universal stress protein n=1 Tax=Nocardioides rotundus TaxID=1774216 RepID=UPI001CBFB35D|nr:universal stress protein [Nocardioides rotundus]UAL29431.1 universal stress protein [Nocardioides rotundus]